MICRAVPYEGKEPYIFVSYCHADKALVYPIIEQMSLDGYRTWYDVGNKPGINWLLNIEDHLEHCKVVIAFISKHSSDSDNCSKEIVFAMKCRKKVIPVLIEDTALPRGLRMQLADLHYLERKNFPSDKELLKKCYEAEDCNECKVPSGSIPLRNVDPLRPREEPHKGLLDGWTPFDRKKKKETAPDPVPVPVSAPVSTPVSTPVSAPVSAPVSTPVSDPQPDPNLRPKRVPDPIPKAKPKANVAAKYDPPVKKDSGMVTCMSLDDSDGDKTIYCSGLSDGTIINGYSDIFDDDRTVLISRNLAILLHPAEQKAYKLKSPKITIGRSQIRCDVAIEGNDSISKVHAIIRQTKQDSYIEDANSSNGTYIKGEKIEPGVQIPLENPAIFQLNDETLILLSGPVARKFEKKTSVSLLINDDGTAVRVMDSDTLALNRNNKWPDGTLADPKVHRAAHALLSQRKDGVYLVDESPEKGNGTYLNGSRLRCGSDMRLSSGDRIRLGDTTLEFISIEIPS